MLWVLVKFKTKKTIIQGSPFKYSMEGYKFPFTVIVNLKNSLLFLLPAVSATIQLTIRHPA